MARMPIRCNRMIERVTIVGMGRVGGALATKLESVGIDVRAVRRDGFDSWRNSDEPLGDIVIIAVRDQDVVHIAEEIAYVVREAAQSPNRLSKSIVIHVNGSMRLDVLQACKDAGARVGAAHPFQTFANQTSANQTIASNDSSVLDGIGWGVECDDDVWPSLQHFVELTGGIPHRLVLTDDDHKRVYHVAAIAASNYTYAAYELGRRLAQKAGIPVDTFLLPIIDRTHRNAAQALRDNTAFPLTGPIQRGDVAAVAKQLEAMPEHEKVVYIHLSLALLNLNKDNMPAETFSSMSTLLLEALDYKW